ncbi:VanZ family protein [Bacillus enclensis]|nr:VanZ family protein [[Bacillus] enclensis]
MTLPLLLKRFRSFKKVVLASLCLSLTFELTQLLFNFGSFDVDDLTLNTFGGILGYTPFHTLTSYKYHKKKSKVY